jgi:hydrogenase/urease accessory protein HupE
MKSITLTLTGLSVTLASATVSAHPGEHHDLDLIAGLTHLLTEHALPVAIAVIAGGLIARRLLRA